MIRVVARHLREREEQQQALKVDPDAASWRQTLGPPACAPASQHAIQKTANDVLGAVINKETHEQKLGAQPQGDPNPGGSDDMVAAEHDQTKSVAFLCSVVPLSLAIRQLGITTVDLLKVDVEGDELAVLHGIDDDDWPNIRQVRIIGDQTTMHTKPSYLVRLLRRDGL